MRARKRGVLKVASTLLGRLVQKLEAAGLVSKSKEITRTRRGSAVSSREAVEAKKAPPAPMHADERTIRRIAEAQRGGLSSEESAARYARGENPGGRHHKAVRRDEGPERERPGIDEPEDRKATRLHNEKHMAATRRGG